MFVASFVGYGQLNAGFPAFGREVGGISTQALGLAFAANTAVIVVFQLFVLQRIEGRRRTRVIVVMSAIWGVSFLALGATGLLPGTLIAALLFAFCAGVFGFGETFFQPTLPAMVNDLAPDHLRGRYNAAMSIAWQSASVVGPELVRRYGPVVVPEGSPQADWLARLEEVRDAATRRYTELQDRAAAMLNA